MQTTLPSSARPFTACSRNFLVLRGSARTLGQGAKRLTESCQHLFGVANIEKINSRRVVALDETEFQFAHEPVTAIQKSSRTMTMH